MKWPACGHGWRVLKFFDSFYLSANFLKDSGKVFLIYSDRFLLQILWHRICICDKILFVFEPSPNDLRFFAIVVMKFAFMYTIKLDVYLYIPSALSIVNHVPNSIFNQTK